jgi:magnesium-transporting ATPase (P-type)
VGTVKEANATDKAILMMYKRFGYDVEEMREKHIPEPYTRFQFTSKRKKMSTVLENVEESSTGKRLMVKGASEMVLGTCSHFIDENGERQELTEDKINYLKENIIKKFASDALRNICVAYKDLEEGQGGPDHDEMSSDGFNREVELEGNTCIAILGIKDVIRPEVPGAIE